MCPDQQTIAVYQSASKDPQWTDRTEDIQEYWSYIEEFSSRLPEGARILDWGCGPGHFANAFTKLGFEVEASDASPNAVEVARSKYDVNALCESFDALTALNHYDGIWANFSLLHAKRDELVDLLRLARDALRPNGLLHLGMKLGRGEGRDALGRFFTYYSEKELQNTLESAGFTVITKRLGRGAGLSQTESSYVVFLSHG